jgi:hypothetical protein
MRRELAGKTCEDILFCTSAMQYNRLYHPPPCQSSGALQSCGLQSSALTDALHLGPCRRSLAWRQPPLRTLCPASGPLPASRHSSACLAGRSSTTTYGYVGTRMLTLLPERSVVIANQSLCQALQRAGDEGRSGVLLRWGALGMRQTLGHPLFAASTGGQLQIVAPNTATTMQSRMRPSTLGTP